ncbi:phage head closure protein [Pseudogracilibacillus auburnensis]|uniref:phage head closure protein n=1 Tax=Pseudogracilibacillus auburnensis TaxID=1494959 RepID=UPI001F623BB9|nr:phage head closure protein [Pseudogracilibacillus auburnensis]
MKPINPGDFDQRLLFTQPLEKNENGFPVPGTDIYSKAWGALKTLKGKTFYEAAQTNREHNREFTVRYQKILMDGIRPKHVKIKWRDIEHKIESIENDDGQNITMTVFCKAVE